MFLFNIRSTKHPLTISTARNQFRSRAHVRIMQPSLLSGGLAEWSKAIDGGLAEWSKAIDGGLAEWSKAIDGGLAEWSKAIEYVSLQNLIHKTSTNNIHS
ncbi:hypothetical protein N7501_010939 [Penicillium viridicatum]|nr:hypothetical protein N7501_010939 [Penicillium viridicatum]